MQKLKNKVAVALASIASFMLAFAVPAAAAGTVVVSGNTSVGENQPGWMFNRDTSTSTPYEFNTDEASIGSGSLYILPIGANASDKFIAENFILTSMESVESISYDFIIGDGGDESDEEQFYMNVYANFGVSDQTKFYDCRYNIVPTIGSTTAFTTVTFDPTQAYPVTERNTSPQDCPTVPADMGEGAFIRAFSLNVGDTNVSDVGLDGYLDNVVVRLVDDETTYDFEPVNYVDNKEECKNGGWEAGLANGDRFKNQGDCVSYFASKTRNKPALANQAQLRF